jgi:hypothetical protein
MGPFEFFFDAFRELSSCRPQGLGLSPIPFTAIVEYSRLFDVGDFEDFLWIIRKMDDCYLNLEAKKSKPKGTNSGDRDKSHSRNSRHKGK